MLRCLRGCAAVHRGRDPRILPRGSLRDCCTSVLQAMLQGPAVRSSCASRQLRTILRDMRILFSASTPTPWHPHAVDTATRCQSGAAMRQLGRPSRYCRAASGPGGWPEADDIAIGLAKSKLMQSEVVARELDRQADRLKEGGVPWLAGCLPWGDVWRPPAGQRLRYCHWRS